ncbi:MAG: hypothetical protein V1779_10950 [bacterium]
MFYEVFKNINFAVCSYFFPKESEVKATECDTGWVELYRPNIPIVVDGDTCLYNLWLCVKCNAGTYPIPFEVKLNCHGPVDNDCLLDVPKVVEEIKKLITDANWVDANLGDDCFAGTGPCNPYYPLTFKELIGHIPVCWKKYNFIDDDNKSHILYMGCDNMTCITEYRYCWNGSDFEMILMEDPYIQGSGNCIYPEPPDPLPGLYTGCFYIPGECWP